MAVRGQAVLGLDFSPAALELALTCFVRNRHRHDPRLFCTTRSLCRRLLERHCPVRTFRPENIELGCLPASPPLRTRRTPSLYLSKVPNVRARTRGPVREELLRRSGLQLSSSI